MAAADVLAEAREAFRTQAWAAAFDCFAEADAMSPLETADLEVHARSAFLVGREETCISLLDRAYRERLDRGEREQAAECAFWLGFNLMHRGDMAQAGGWLARAEQLAAEDPDGVVRGLLLIPVALQALMGGEAENALARFTEARRAGERSGSPELLALAGLGTGRTMIQLGDLEHGMARLDEVMVGVTAGEVSPIVSGIVYCAVIIACHETYQVRRAAEWTRALSRWCDTQPDLVPFRGQCLVHRAQILVLTGAWQDASEQVRLARERLSDPPGQPAIGMAFYEQGELHRLRGEHAAAEDAYRQSSDCGHETQPGFALLRLAQGKVEAALAGIERALEESPAGSARPRMLAAYVEIALAAGAVDRARAAADDLAGLAGDTDATMLRAMSAQATGAVLLAEGDPRAALGELRRAWTHWQELDAPYLGARVRLLRGRCCEELGDRDTALMEFDAAARVFRQLQATPDLTLLEKLGVRPTADHGGPLTTREVQVLRCVATGKTNRAVAEELFLSEKTVARHVSNIFTKLDLSSRSAATAYAYEHNLL